MDLAYLTGQRPADVLLMRRDDIEGDYLLVQQSKTSQKLRIMMRNEDGALNSLGRLVEMIGRRTAEYASQYLLISKHGKRLTATMLRHRWDDARLKACEVAAVAGDTALVGRIQAFQFRDIRPKAASESKNLDDASMLLGYTKSDITKKIYRHIGVTAKPSK
ncbi:tyrosine-type recombinase/integrase [Pseudomonas sp. RIT-PI-AD]|uniref:tyrosine-type recombinase/integrase n=1 Tax=Pseudomonas sp. RIT-PI-AD TaxID=3035294 RepID=UPI003207DC49